MIMEQVKLNSVTSGPISVCVCPLGGGSQVHPEGGAFREGAARSQEGDRDHERPQASTHRAAPGQL